MKKVFAKLFLFVLCLAFVLNILLGSVGDSLAFASASALDNASKSISPTIDDTISHNFTDKIKVDEVQGSNLDSVFV